MSLRSRFCWFFALLFAGILFASNSAEGIMVSPGAFTMQNAEVGKDLDLGVDLAIKNSSTEEKLFVVRTIKPSEAKKEWLKGYSEIPETSWFYFPEEKIKIKANETGKLRMHLRIPDEDKYLNQRWMVFVEVTTEAETGMTFKLSLKPGYMIETESMSDIKEKPYGILGIVPGTVKAENVVAGESKKVNFRLYNNDSVAHDYDISPYIPKASSLKQDISGSAGYEWIKDAGWVRPAKTHIKLEPGEVKEVALDIQIPEGSKHSDQGWESIVFVKPDKGLAGFVRVLIEGKE